jgi:hypothetical protein
MCAPSESEIRVKDAEDYREQEGRAMSMARTVNRSILGVLVVTMLVLACSASSAMALSPWWHLTSGQRPIPIQPGLAQDEVQEVTVSATGGLVILFGPKETIAVVNWNASVAEMREGLEGIYGPGNVEVTGGPGDETGSKPYIVKSIGELADQPVGPLTVNPQTFEDLRCTGATGPNCKAETIVSEKTKGRFDGQIILTASNLGDANINGETTPVTIIDKLPTGLKAVAIQGFAGEFDNLNFGPVQCSLASLTCTFSHVLPPFEYIEVLVTVVADGSTSGGMNEMSVSGGGAPSASVARPAKVGGAPTGFGVENYEMTPENEGGTPDTQAGSHMFQLTTTFTLDQVLDENLPNPAGGLAKDLHFSLPPGLIGNATAISQCPIKDFLTPVEGVENKCTPRTAVGVANITVRLPNLVQVFTVPVFNITPSVGEPARFGFFLLRAPVILDTKLRTGSDYGVTVDVTNITQTAAFFKNEVVFWGVPGDSRHDNQRGWGCLLDEQKPERPQPCNPLGEEHPLPLLSMPTSCTGPLQTTVEAASWIEPENFLTAGSNVPMPAMDGCNRLPFAPSIKVIPDGTAGSTPTGLTVDEHVPQETILSGSGLAESDVQGLTTTLPVGVALNPAAADGLEACSESQIGLQNDNPPTCPDASKVATVKIKTPLIPNALEGAAYLATQNQNPFGSLVGLYIYAHDPIAGVSAKAAGEVLENPVTGQLTAHFEHDPVFQGAPVGSQFLPEVPFEDVELHFFGGDRAPLSTPALCGSYTTTGTFTPWAENGTTESASTFDINTGPNGGPCHSPLPFAPSLTAGTTSIQAGGFSPFTMTMSRPDGSQNLQAIKLKMPPGLLGTLATVKLCKEAQANVGTCGPESLIGHTTVGVGVGGDPFTVTGGEVFITEGYGGAPYGLSIVNPAKAGPFDLGKVIVRAKIEVDQITAVLTITTDTTGPYKIPTILDGIPLQIQHVNVSIDRPNFTFNPTNCSPLAITGSLTSDQGSVQGLSVPFQITNCAVLAFKPKLTAKTSGKTSRKAGASLSVKLTYPAGPFDANISKVKVDLPKQLPSRLTTLQKACPDKTFEANPAACPAASIVGHAKATTPVLPVSLQGPAYFVSHGGEEFPQLIIVLQGYGTTVHLVGSTYINPKTSVTSSTFKQVPDVPVGTFELTLPQGNYSALAANGNLCTTKKLSMPTSFVAQNGVEQHTSTPITPTGCAKHAKAKKTVKTKHKSRAKHGKK